MEIIIIAAMSENRVIGKDNALPWSIKEDMAHFRRLTAGWPCIMGRKTWESLPRRPLPGRLNMVISRSPETVEITHKGQGAAVKVFPSLAAALEYCAGAQPADLQSVDRFQKIFICGGASVYREALPRADRIELTLIHKQYEGDAFFPEIDPAVWKKNASADFDNFSFISYNKIT